LSGTGLRFPAFDLGCSGALFGLSAPNPIAAHQNMPPLLSIVDDGIKDEPRVELEERELWQKFHPLVNEMIITKSGRSVHGNWKMRNWEIGGGGGTNCQSTQHFELDESERPRSLFLFGNGLPPSAVPSPNLFFI
jgi:hypothetical protein